MLNKDLFYFGYSRPHNYGIDLMLGSPLVNGLPDQIMRLTTEWFESHDLSVGDISISNPEALPEGPDINPESPDIFEDNILNLSIILSL